MSEFAGDGVDTVTRQVLSRRRDARDQSSGGSAASSSGTPARASKPQQRGLTRTKNEPPTSYNAWINGGLLVFSLYIATFTFVPELGAEVIPPFLVWLVFTIIGVIVGYFEVEEAVLPVFVAAGVDSRLMFRNFGVSLSNQGFWGAAIGVGVNFLGPCTPFEIALPVVAYGLGRIIKRATGSSLSITESVLLASGLANLLVYEGHLYQGILYCGFLGFASSYFLVPRLVRMLSDRTRIRKNEAKIRSLGMGIVLSYVSSAAGAFAVYLRLFGPSVGQLAFYVMDNLELILYWVACLTTAFILAFFASKHALLDTRRKLWHLTAVVMFLPTIRYDFTASALAVAIILFLFLEVLRAAGVPIIGAMLHDGLSSFLDIRDTKGPVVVSHIYLLMGIAAPVFAGPGSPSGLIALGLGDTFASQIGKRWGRLRWFGHKTLEGTLAFFVATVIGSVLTTGAFTGRTVFVCFITALVEATSDINDNLVLPLYMLALTNVVAKLGALPPGPAATHAGGIAT